MLQWDLFLLKYEPILRIVIFVLFLGLFYYWEDKARWRDILMNKKERWTRHLLLGGMSALLVRLVFPTVAISMALVVEQKNIGLLANSSLPSAVNIILAIMGLDLLLYMQHRWFHRIGLFWRVHRVHHSDTALDASTGVRFHPIEYLFIMAVKIMAVLFVGAPVLAVFLFEVLVSVFNLFLHSNIQFSPRLDYFMRFIFVTPRLHRIHHSDIPKEFNANFGFIFSFWDRLLGTYASSPMNGENYAVIGLENYRDPEFQSVSKLLVVPFIKAPSQVLHQAVQSPARKTKQKLSKNDKISD